MRAPAVSFASKFMLIAVVGLLTCGLVPSSFAFAAGADAPIPSLASSLMSGTSNAVREDVALAAPEADAVPEPVIGSFTVDGLTFAVIDESHVELVGVAPSVILSEGSEAAGLSVTLSEAAEGGEVEGSNESHASEAGLVNLVLPEAVSYEGVDYTLTSIAAYSFYLSGVTSVMLPESVNDVDDRAFRSSDVASVAVAEGNPTYSSSDGALYDAEHLSLLLIPEGKQGAVLLPKTAEVVEASVFSHCPLVDSISVEKDGAAFASENGLLYTSDLTTLLRVPIGATEITIREGCTTIAAGALEACASLTTINAPATVTSISPDVFHAVPTVSLPAASAILSEGSEAEGSDEGQASTAGDQLTAMVALSSVDDNLPQVEPAAISLSLPGDADASPWRSAGFVIEEAQDDAELSEDAAEAEPDLPVASLDSASTYAGAYDITVVNAEGSTLYKTNASGSTNTPIDSRVIGCGAAEHQVHVRFLDKGGSLIVQLWHSKTTDDSYYRWVKPGYVLVGVKVTNGAGTLSDEIRATEVGTSYSGPSSIKGAGRTISPIFEKVTYTVKLDGNGATTMGTDSVQVEYGQAMPAIAPPKRTGYRFLGYFSSSATTGGTQYYDAAGKSVHDWDRCEEYPTSLSTTVTKYLYARWGSGVCDVRFDCTGGTRWGSEIWVPDDPKITMNEKHWYVVNDTVRTGYVFTGWWTAATGGTQVYDANGVAIPGTAYWDTSSRWCYNGDPTFYAQWDPILTVNMNGGQAECTIGPWAGTSREVWQVTAENRYGLNFLYNAQTHWGSFWNYGDQGTTLNIANPAREGYQFAGWSYSSTGPADDIGMWLVSSGPTTIYAVWDPILTVNMNGGQAECTIGPWAGTSREVWQVTAENRYGLNFLYNAQTHWGSFWNYGDQGTTLNIANPAREGYQFAGWSYSSTGPADDIGMWLVSSGPTTIYAVWDPILTVNMNGGSAKAVSGSSIGAVGESWQLTANYAVCFSVGVNTGHAWQDGGGEKVTTIEAQPRAGYRFAGWSYSKDGPAEDISIWLVSSGPMTIYAVWSPNTITLTWDSAGGSTVANTTQTYSPTAKVGLPEEPIREGYTFKGWYTSTSDGTQITGSTALPSANTTYHAQWTLHVFTISFESNVQGVQAPASMEVRYGSDAVLPKMERKGYAQIGWDTHSAGTGTRYQVGSPCGTLTSANGETITLYAIWKAVVSADAPISATVRLDVLGVEDQAMDEEEPGYLESRCGEPLKVAEVSFEKKPGATDLFGAHVTDIELQALPGKDASWATDAPAFSFALDAAGDAATEDDATKLAPLSMSGYEVRIPISYRFLIPDALLDEVLGAIDPATFEDKKTPVCSVVYTVALQSPPV